ncbi:hypothetical protein HAX54_020800 [Datura stramonium]|uniref:Uncharacterized protein n=1 Tax=Datura stramonium TaxID=4076 RepID=A0ABS8S2Q7_DATST|nr:hypothetical protein [Datura stramonium]
MKGDLRTFEADMSFKFGTDLNDKRSQSEEDRSHGLHHIGGDYITNEQHKQFLAMQNADPLLDVNTDTNRCGAFSHTGSIPVTVHKPVDHTNDQSQVVVAESVDIGLIGTHHEHETYDANLDTDLVHEDATATAVDPLADVVGQTADTTMTSTQLDQHLVSYSVLRSPKTLLPAKEINLIYEALDVRSEDGLVS